MEYGIKFTDSNGIHILQMEEDITAPFDWFANHCRESVRGETLELLLNGVAIQTFAKE